MAGINEWLNDLKAPSTKVNDETPRRLVPEQPRRWRHRLDVGTLRFSPSLTPKCSAKLQTVRLELDNAQCKVSHGCLALYPFFALGDRP